MSSPDCAESIDAAAVRMRTATIKAAVLLGYVMCGTAAVYAAVTWTHPHRAALIVVLIVGTAGTAVVARLPGDRIVRSAYREAFFLVWSLLDLAVITAGALCDGGTSSPLALAIFLPVVFSATSYPRRSVAVVGGLSLAGYVFLAVVAGSASWAYEWMWVVVLACTGGMSAWQAHNHDRQRVMLVDVSRTDPLTNCLNRRGFEERALADIATADRRAGHGAILLLDVDGLKRVNDGQGHAAGDHLLRSVVETLQATVRPADAVGRLGGDEFAVLFADMQPSCAIETARRVRAALRRRATPCSVGLAIFPEDGASLDELLRRADSRLYATRHGRLEQVRVGADERLSWAAALARAIDARMNAEHEHSCAVADRAVSIARTLGWDAQMLGLLRIAAMLHDVGKVIIPDRVLCKPGRLNDEEFELMKTHSTAGAELVAGIEELDAIVPWIRHSHERYDGRGYPDGLRGEDIPQASRIMLVADAFDAITSTRPYRAALSFEHACEELKRGAGTQFDPQCVHALLSCLGVASANGTPTMSLSASGEAPTVAMPSVV